MNDDQLVTGDIAGMQELTADGDHILNSLAAAAARHDVMVSISISPYSSIGDGAE